MSCGFLALQWLVFRDSHEKLSSLVVQMSRQKRRETAGGSEPDTKTRRRKVDDVKGNNAGSCTYSHLDFAIDRAVSLWLSLLVMLPDFVKSQTRILFAAIIVIIACLPACKTASRESVDWRKRATSVTVGMTHSEVQAILPPWNGPPGSYLSPPVVTTEGGPGSAELYWVAEDWQVTVKYGWPEGRDRVREPVKIRQVSYSNIAAHNESEAN
jgi:hypothetical protein